MAEGKKTRNANGQDTVYYDEKKKCFIAQVSVPLNNGDRNKMDKEGNKKKTTKRLTATSKKSKKEALERVQEKAQEYTSQKKTVNNKTVSGLTEEFIKYKASQGIKPSTHKNYDEYYNGYIKNSAIAEKEITEISEEELRGFYSCLFENGNKRKKKAGRPGSLSVSTVNHVHVLLNGSFLYACKKKYIQENPHMDIKKFKENYKLCGSYTPKEKREKAFSKDEISRFINNNGNKKDMFYNMFCIMLCTGLRSGEARALCWNDIDMGNKTLHVNKTLVYTEKKYIPKLYGKQESWGNEKEYIEQPPKSEASERYIPLNKMALEALERQKEWQERWKTTLKEFYKDNGTVFSDEKGDYVQGQRVLAHLRRLLVKSGIETKHTVHDLRHTFCTLLRDNNIPVEVTKELMGHSDVNMTLSIYTHTYNPKKIKSVDTLGKAIACM